MEKKRFMFYSCENAKKIIGELCQEFRSPNIFGVAGIGSFWIPRQQHNPKDIDIFFYVNNTEQFIQEERSLFINVLIKNKFDLPFQAHLSSPYSSCVFQEIKKQQLIFKDGHTLIWGVLPMWLS